MPDDERTRRRLGDATKSRIADLASGWTVESPAAAPDPPPAPGAPGDTEPMARTPASEAAPGGPQARPKRRTNPPPPPGSPERSALEQKILATTERRDDTTAKLPPRATPNGSMPPPPPQPAIATRPNRATGSQGVVQARPDRQTGSQAIAAARPKGPSSPPPPPPPRAHRTTGSQAIAAARPNRPSGAQPTLDAAAARDVRPPLVVPVGEFDGARMIDERTVERDPAEALLKIPDAETPVEALLEDDIAELDDDDDAEQPPASARHAPTDAATEKFERGDPTLSAPPDATELHAPRSSNHTTGGTLRASAALRRKRGLAGDVRYVFTAVMGVRRAKRELGEIEHRQSLRQTSRRRHLVTLGRTAAVLDALVHPALGKARDHLAVIEDERSKHAGAVAASDAELERVRREREAKATQYVADLEATDAELAELAAKLEPLEKAATVARKRGQDLRDELHRIEKQIGEVEARLESPKDEKIDRAALQAELATCRANKQAVLRDEPVIAGELDALNPRVAQLEATRSALHAKKAELAKAEQEDQRRSMELLDAIGAKRKVVERAAVDAETARDQALFELGERLYVDRPRQLSAHLSPIDQIDLELGEGERRAMELKEILSNIDKAKLARGLAMIILALGAAASIGWLVLYAVT